MDWDTHKQGFCFCPNRRILSQTYHTYYYKENKRECRHHHQQPQRHTLPRLIRRLCAPSIALRLSRDELHCLRCHRLLASNNSRCCDPEWIRSATTTTTTSKQRSMSPVHYSTTVIGNRCRQLLQQLTTTTAPSATTVTGGGGGMGQWPYLLNYYYP